MFEVKFCNELMNQWIWQYHINKLVFIVCLQSHHHQPLQQHCHHHHCFHPLLSTCCSTCSINICKTSSMITVPLSRCKFFMSMVYLSHIYNGSFSRLLQEQSAYFQEAYVEASTHLRNLSQNNNGNIILLAKCCRNYIVPIVTRGRELEKALICLVM